MDGGKRKKKKKKGRLVSLPFLMVGWSVQGMANGSTKSRRAFLLLSVVDDGIGA